MASKIKIGGTTFVFSVASPEQRREAIEIDREARRRARYYKGVARRIRYGILSPEEREQLAEDKRRVQALRDATK